MSQSGKAPSPTLNAGIAERLARIALGHVTREFPNKLDHVLGSPEDVQSPRALHPTFFGSFDWHSCVHGHWLLARIYRRYPLLSVSRQIGKLLDAQFTSEKVAGELAYLARPFARGFERPYGWAWTLMLQGELQRHTSEEAGRWAAALRPLTEEFVRRFQEYLSRATYPVRAGVHSNTAFALLLAREYADAAHDTAFGSLCAEVAGRWYGRDRDCQAWEPSQDEFLSPALTEAVLMSDVLPEAEFHVWFNGFLPHVAERMPTTLFLPATVTDRTDGKIAHLDGLNLSRAWCWNRLAARLKEQRALQEQARGVAAAHLSSAMEHIVGDYMGEHWLASFALLALEPIAD